jgi:hypothetical protein
LPPVQDWCTVRVLSQLDANRLPPFRTQLNPLPVQFKSLLPGQEGCIFFSGYLNVRKYHYALVRLGRQAAFKSTTLSYVKAGKGLKMCGGVYPLHIQWGLGSQTPQFTNKFSEQKTSRMTNGFSDYKHASWQQRQAESISAGVSFWLTLAQYTSLLDFGLRTFRFTNGLQERIKFVNRGPTVLPDASHPRRV